MLSRRKYQITVALILKFVSKHLESLPVLQEVRRQAGIGDVPFTVTTAVAALPHPVL